MKLLVVFLLAVLSFSLAEAKLVPKCELRDQLKTVVANLTLKAQPKEVTVDDLVAKIVCHAELASGFNTSAVNQVIRKEVDHNAENNGHSNQPHARRRRHDKGHSSQTQPIPPTHPAQNCTLYGIFQLSSCQACNNSVTPTANICGIPCSNLLNDDISVDITCLLKILLSPGNNNVMAKPGKAHGGNDHHDGAKPGEAQGGKIPPMFEKKCEDVKAPAYFAGCN